MAVGKSLGFLRGSESHLWVGEHPLPDRGAVRMERGSECLASMLTQHRPPFSCSFCQNNPFILTPRSPAFVGMWSELGSGRG